MNLRPFLIFTVLSAWQIGAAAQREDSSVPRTLNLQQAVELALKHNHDVRISSLKVAVSHELLTAPQEARRVAAEGLEQGTYLRSQAEATAAKESEAQMQLLQSQLKYAQAQDELNEVIGQNTIQ